MNSFAKYPDIATLWSDQNNLTADEVLPNTNSADWDCPDCHITFHARIIDMVNGNADCPYCSGRLPIVGTNDLQTTNPDLIKEWDYEKNSPIYPYMVKKEAITKYGGNVKKDMNGKL